LESARSVACHVSCLGLYRMGWEPASSSISRNSPVFDSSRPWRGCDSVFSVRRIDLVTQGLLRWVRGITIRLHLLWNLEPASLRVFVDLGIIWEG